MSKENVEILRRLYEQWASGDLAADCFDPDVEYSRIGTETPDMEGRWLGLDEFSIAMLEYLRPFSDLRIEAERIIDLGGDRVLVLSRQTAQGKQSGVPIDHEAGDVFTLRDGKIVRYDAYWNRADALEAAGLPE
jgi:ketosteroid isomerase-like protein